MQNNYQKIVDFLGEILMNTIVVATEIRLNNKTVGNTFLSSGHNFVHLPRSERTGLRKGELLEFGLF